MMKENLVGLSICLFSLFINNGKINAQETIELPPKDPANESLENDIFDDDLDFTYNPLSSGPIALSEGDTVIINQKYDMCYNVLSDDNADVEALAFFGRSQGGTFDFDLQLSDCMGNLVGSKISRTGLNFSTLGTTQALSEDGVLGNLEDLMIGDFHITLKVTSGAIGFNGYTFNWEADDIEKKITPEPNSILGLLALGTLGAGSALKRKQQKKSTQNQKVEAA